MPAFSLFLDIFRPENDPKLRDNEDHQMNELFKQVGETIFIHIGELIANFETTNPGLSVIKARFYRALRKLLEDSKRDSYVIDGRNINYTIKQYFSNRDEKSILKKVIDYQNKENFLGNVKWIKSPFSRILVIAILLGLKIDDDNTVTIKYHKYSFSEDFDGILKKITPVLVYHFVSGGSSSPLSSADTEPLFSPSTITIVHENLNVPTNDEKISKKVDFILPDNRNQNELYGETSFLFNEEGDPLSVY
jgi:hypothetical protein